MAQKIKLGELLVRAGVLDESKLQSALAEQKRWGGRLGKILVNMGFMSEELLVKALSKQLGIPRADFASMSVPAEIVDVLEPDFLHEHVVCPVAFDAQRRLLTLAMADPTQAGPLDALRFKTGLRVEPLIAAEGQIAQAIERLLDGHSSMVADRLPERYSYAGDDVGANAFGRPGQPTGSIPDGSSGFGPPGQSLATGGSPGMQAPSFAMPSYPSWSGGPGGSPSSAAAYAVASTAQRPVPQAKAVPFPVASTGSPMGGPGLGLPVGVPGAGLGLGMGSGPGATVGGPRSTGSTSPVSPGSQDLLRTLEAAQIQQQRAIRAMLELLIEKGFFTREEYLLTLNKNG